MKRKSYSKEMESDFFSLEVISLLEEMQTFRLESSRSSVQFKRIVNILSMIIEISLSTITDRYIDSCKAGYMHAQCANYTRPVLFISSGLIW